MATYKTDRDRNYGFVGKFKFSYTVRFLTASLNENNFTSAKVLSSAYIIFKEDVVEIGKTAIGYNFQMNQVLLVKLLVTGLDRVLILRA